MLRRFRFVAFAAVCTFVCLTSATAQPPPGPSARGGVSPSVFAANTVNAGQSKLPTILSGKVIREDLQPASNATIDLSCDEVARGSATAKANGEFALTVERPTNGIQPMALAGCDMVAIIGGLRSEVRQIRSVRYSETQDVGTLIIHSPPASPGGTVSANNLLAPAEARKFLSKGKSAANAQKWSEAQKYLERATQVYPSFAEAWHELGLVLQHESRREEARAAFEHAIAADPVFIRPYFGLVGIAADSQDWTEMKKISDTALASTADPLMLFYNAIANFNLQQFDAAEKSLVRAAQLDRQHQVPQVSLLLGDVLIQRRDFAGAAVRVREFLALSPNGPQAQAARAELSRLDEAVASR